MIVLPATAWRNAYSPIFVDLLATLTHDHVARRAVDADHDGTADYYVAERQPHYSLQSRALQLITRELSARLATGGINFSRDPWDDLYFDLEATRGGMITCGSPKADQYLSMATAQAHHAGGVATGPQLTEAEYLAELTSVLAAAPALASDVAASAASDIALDTEFGTSLAAGIASDFSATRAAYLATLQARFPTRGFI